MSFLGFGKKARTLEEMAKEKGITILNGQIPANLVTDYIQLKKLLVGTGLSDEVAENHLISYAAREKIVYLSDVHRSETPGAKRITAMGYTKRSVQKGSDFQVSA